MRSDLPCTCPVCGFTGLSQPPYDAAGCSSFEICPSCGTEFGYDDSTLAHRELRKRWIASGMKWFSNRLRPPNWDPVTQLMAAGLWEAGSQTQHDWEE